MSEYTFLTDEEVSPPKYNHVLKDGWIWNWFSGYLFPPEIDEEEINTIPAQFLKDNTEIDRLVIQEGITTIGEEAFAGMTNLISVLFPDSLQKIEASAFEGCINLNTIIFHGQCYNIGENAFASCTSLEEVTFNDHLYNSIGNGCFKNTNLKRVIIPGSVLCIPEDCFANCHNLSEVYIRSGALYRDQTLDIRAFRGCEKLKKVIATGHLKHIIGIEEANVIDVIIDNGKPVADELKSIWQSKLDSKVELLKESMESYLQIKNTDSKEKEEKKQSLLSLRNSVQEYSSMNQTSGVDLNDARLTLLKSIEVLSDNTEKDVVQFTPAMLEMLITSNMYKVNDRVVDMYNSYHDLLYN